MDWRGLFKLYGVRVALVEGYVLGRPGVMVVHLIDLHDIDRARAIANEFVPASIRVEFKAADDPDVVDVEAREVPDATSVRTLKRLL